jgi:hypothetical protein
MQTDSILRELDLILDSIITCPHCATARLETMPTDACRILYRCTGCGAKLRAKGRDCCVFCSYGSVPCPPMQEHPAPGFHIRNSLT